jgi:hypothetical protein
VFGKVTAAFSVTEVKGRGALHAHCAIWGTALTPDLLQKVSPNPLLVDEVAKVLDRRVEKIKIPSQIYFASQPTSHQQYLNDYIR